MSTNYTITVNGTPYDISTFFKTSATNPGTNPTTGNYKFKNAAATFDASFVAYANHPLLTGTLTNFKYTNTDIIKLYQPYYVDYTATTATDVSNSYNFPSWASKVYFAIQASGLISTTITKTINYIYNGVLNSGSGDLASSSALLTHLRSTACISSGTVVANSNLALLMNYTDASNATNVNVNSVISFSYTPGGYGQFGPYTSSGSMTVSITSTKTFSTPSRGQFTYGKYNIPSQRPAQYTITLNNNPTPTIGAYPYQGITINDASSSYIHCYSPYIVNSTAQDTQMGNSIGFFRGGNIDVTGYSNATETNYTTKYIPIIPTATYGGNNQYGLIRIWFIL